MTLEEQVAETVAEFVASHPGLNRYELDFMGAAFLVAGSRDVELTMDQAYSLLLEIIGEVDVLDTVH